VRDVVLAVNREYIRSAAWPTSTARNPLQAAGVLSKHEPDRREGGAIMNDQELQTLILSSYENDSQTLTSDAESNMLKFKELMGILSEEEAKRWRSIQRTYQENIRMRGIDQDDAVGQVVVQLRSFSDGLEAIREAVVDSVGDVIQQKQDTVLQDRVNRLIGELGKLEAGVTGINATLAQGLVQLHENSRATAAAMAAAGSQSAGSRRRWSRRLSRACGIWLPAGSGNEVRTGRGRAGEPVQEVHVMHQVPRNILNVLRSQFQLMQGWLEPLATAALAQRSDIKKLRTTLEATLQHYGVLLQDLEDAGGEKRQQVTDEAIRQKWDRKGRRDPGGDVEGGAAWFSRASGLSIPRRSASISRPSQSSPAFLAGKRLPCPALQPLGDSIV